MEYQAAWRGLLIAGLILLGAGAWGGEPPAQLKAEASTSDVFDALEHAGVISGHLQLPMVLAFDGRGELTLKIHGRPTEDSSALVAAALSGGEAHQPIFTLNRFRSMFFADTKPFPDNRALVYLTMEESICPPCKELIAEYFSALEASMRDADVSVYVLTIRPDR